VSLLEVVRIDAERNLLLIKGAVPGSENGQVVVRPAAKAPTTKAPTTKAPATKAPATKAAAGK
jgi:ribosomal protein L3